jgi:hypothetical protein
MRVTNKHNLPAPLVAAVSRMRPPKPDRISVTQLIGPPQIRLLTMEHWDVLEEDAADRLWATMGGLMHKLLEAHAESMGGHHAEGFLETEVEGYKVTGIFDLHQEGGTLTDYKFTSVYTTMNGIKPEWVTQLNVYAELLRRSGAEVTRLQIVTIYRDWSKGKAYERGYPRSQVQVFDVPLWVSERASSFMTERVQLHSRAQHGLVVDCSPEERWARPPKFAVMKEGRKRAVRLLDSRGEADARASDEGKGHYVVERPGVSVRCESYCSVSAFCPQYERMKAEEEALRDDG